MTTTNNPAGSSAAGQGRLAAVIATRGGLAAAAAPFVIEHREALIYMLCQAAELEHAIMCQYLFAAFSLKQHEDEGLSPDELAAARRWRKQVMHVAVQEMLHLALVHNLLSAVGAAPHMARPNLPQPADHYPAGVVLAMLPFGEQALRHFMFLERPEGMDLDDAEGLAACGRAQPLVDERDIVPQLQDFATIGHMYRSIEAGLAHLAATHGEDWLFIGPPRAQATERHFGWPELVPVTDLASAQRAIDTILEQGEGPRGDWRDAHFGQFVQILDEYEQRTEASPGFDPVRPVLAANVRPHERDADVPLITDQLTARVTDLFNVAYEVLLNMFERFFAHTTETDAQLDTLAAATIALMARVIGPLGSLVTTLPAGPEYPGRNAGPSFELFYETDFLMPHREAAWAMLSERLDEAGALCAAIQQECGSQAAGSLEPVRSALSELARTLAGQLPAARAHARRGPTPDPVTPGDLAALLTSARDLAATIAAQTRAESTALAGVFGASFAALELAVAACQPGRPEYGFLATRLSASVLRPLASDLAALPPSATPTPTPTPAPASAPASAAAVPSDPNRTSTSASADLTDPVSPADVGSAEDAVWAAAQLATRTLVQLAGGAIPPPGLAEATAGLQDLACQLVPAPQRAARLAALQEIQRGLRPHIRITDNGPYLVTNAPKLLTHLGEEIAAPPMLALCRCGASARKPFCDGAHAAAGFTGDQDPKRVPDHRDTYPGQEVTIFDNRGICQHSGLCTDRLTAVFRTSQEPFVAPSGGRMDEIIRAVRDCPSGALSYAVDDRERRANVDWAGARSAAVEVTKDGPYRVTGGLPLLDSGGRDPGRAEGSSREHFALCRCGHSQNKPFCSGMHWYVSFTDPVPEPGGEPTLFEWAGGRPALTRMTRLLHEKHLPADPLLAPVFAELPPGRAEVEADWLAQVLGGPAGGGAGGGFPALAAGQVMTQEQQARWVALATLAAGEAKLPDDPQFRSAFSALLEWSSRLVAPTGPAAPAGGAPVTGGPLVSPVPRWTWGPAGPPDTTTPVAAESDEAPVTRPGPGETVTFEAHIRPLFRARDRQSMSFVFDLWSLEDVRTHAAGILERLVDGSMPCDAAWPSDRIEVFRRWLESGAQG
ncbi:MAG: ferritin-like domain-containing protein [Actinomycetota bacterium]